MNTSVYHYDALGHLGSVHIADGRPRDVAFLTDATGTILERDEADANSGTGDPRDLYYYFNGMRVGDISNNGTSDTDYVASMKAHIAVAPATPGPFRGGATTGTPYADFDQAFDPINGLTYESTASRYTVQAGDTLQTIAQTVWGDSSLWYLIADVNGLDGSENLAPGRDLIIPNKVHNAHNTSDVYRVYDPNEAIGNTSPTTPKPAPAHHGGGCGVFGQILLIAVAVAITALIKVPVTSFFSGLFGASAAGASAGAVAAAETAGAIVGGVVTGGVASAVSQGFGVLTGIQDRFSFKGVALAAISGGVSAGIGEIPGLSGGTGVNGVLQGIARGALGNVATQGIALAAGLQHSFDWTGVAVGGAVGGAVSGVHVAGLGGYAGQLVGGLAGAIAGGAARTLIDGSDFGDNIMAALPEVVGSTIGELVAAEVSTDQATVVPRSQKPVQVAYNSPNIHYQGQDGAPQSDAGGDIIVTASKERYDLARRGFGYNLFHHPVGLTESLVGSITSAISHSAIGRAASAYYNYQAGVTHAFVSSGARLVTGAYYLATTNPLTTIKSTAYGIAQGIDSIAASESVPAEVRLSQISSAFANASAYDIGNGVGNALVGGALLAAPEFATGRFASLSRIGAQESIAPTIEAQYLAKYQLLYDEGAAAINAQVDNGMLIPTPGIPINTYLGQRIDNFARTGLQDYAAELGHGSDKPAPIFASRWLSRFGCIFS